MYKVYLLLLTFTKIVIQFTQCTTIHNIVILHKIAINTMQNKVNKVMILCNNNNSSSKHPYCIIAWNRMTVSLGLRHWRHEKGSWRGTNVIGCHWWGRDTRGLAVGWCHKVPLRLRLGSRLSQMMADDWVLPLVPLRSSVIILVIIPKAMPWAWMMTSGDRNRYYSKCG